MACCCSCKNLDTKQKVSGNTSGAKYYCKKLDTAVSGDNPACEKYEKGFRSNSDVETIYKDGKNWSNDTVSVGTYIIIAVVLIIILIIIRILNPNLF